MGLAADAWFAVAAIAASTASSAYSSAKERKAQRENARKQEAAAKKQLAAEDEAQNRANRKQADIEGLLDAGDTSGAMGNSATLTGAGGAPVNKDLLGKGGTLGS
jgi:hypothetical protein